MKFQYANLFMEQSKKPKRGILPLIYHRSGVLQKIMLIKSPFGTFFGDNVSTGAQVLDLLASKRVMPHVEWRIEQNGKPVEDKDDILADTVVLVLPAVALPGGKGGFGSLLRSIGAQIEKTTNHEAMRDLSGRRQRDINNEQRLKEYVAKQAERQREESQKKEAKLVALRRLAEGENVCKHDFHDPTYDKARDEATERVHDAIEAAYAGGSTSKEEGVSSTQANAKRKSTDTDGPPKKKAGLWLGEGLDDLDDSDLSDSDDDSDSEQTSRPGIK